MGVLTCENFTLDHTLSTQRWLVWQKRDDQGRNEERHWFRNEESQLMAQWFWSKIFLQGSWLEVELEGSLQARYDAEQGLGLLEECVRWRVCQSVDAELWARVNLCGTAAGDNAVAAL